MQEVSQQHFGIVDNEVELSVEHIMQMKVHLGHRFEYIDVWTDKSMQQSKTIQRQHSLTSRTRQYDIDWTMWKAYHANGGYLFDYIII